MQPSSLSGRLLMGRPQTEVFDAARVAALLNSQQGSLNLQSGLGGTGLAGLGAGPSSLNLGLGSLPQPQQQQQLGDQLALLSQFPSSLFPQYNSAEQLGTLRNVGKTRSSDSRSSSAYASRHQAAEQRRRTRINERLELLRKLVPHAERANTAVFLEEVIKYIEALKCRTLELEAALEAATGKPVAKSLAPQAPAGGGGGGLGSTPEPADSPDRSPRQPSIGLPGKQQNGLQQLAAAGANPSAPGSLTLASLASAAQDAQEALAAQEAQQQLSQPAHQVTQQPELLEPPPQLQLPQLPGPSAAATAAAQLNQLQQAQVQAGLFPHAGSLSLSASGGTLSLGGGGGLGAGSVGGLSLSQLAGLQASHGLGLPTHSSHGHLSSSHQHGHHNHSHHHHHATVAAQLNELQKLHAMQTLQQSTRPAAAAPPPAFHPVNNKAFLHFNEDLFGGMKPELGHPAPCRSVLGPPVPTTSATTSLQLTNVVLPTDSNTLLAAETARKTMSGSPVSSEESGVPLKKRKVLML